MSKKDRLCLRMKKAGYGSSGSGDLSPRVSVLDTVVFLIGKNFSLRSGKENRNLKFSQLTLEPANDKEPEKPVYVAFGEKNNQGELNY